MCVVGPAQVGVLFEGCTPHWLVVCCWQTGPAACPKGEFHQALAGYDRPAGQLLRPNMVRLRFIAMELEPRCFGLFTFVRLFSRGTRISSITWNYECELVGPWPHANAGSIDCLLIAGMEMGGVEGHMRKRGWTARATAYPGCVPRRRPDRQQSRQQGQKSRGRESAFSKEKF